VKSISNDVCRTKLNYIIANARRLGLKSTLSTKSRIIAVSIFDCSRYYNILTGNVHSQKRRMFEMFGFYINSDKWCLYKLQSIHVCSETANNVLTVNQTLKKRLCKKLIKTCADISICIYLEARLDEHF